VWDDLDFGPGAPIWDNANVRRSRRVEINAIIHVTTIKTGSPARGTRLPGD